MKKEYKRQRYLEQKQRIEHNGNNEERTEENIEEQQKNERKKKITKALNDRQRHLEKKQKLEQTKIMIMKMRI